VAGGLNVSNTLAATARSAWSSDVAALDAAISAADTATSQGTALANLPATPAGPVPAALRPSLAQARKAQPDPYRDGCNLYFGDVTPRSSCLYGDPNGPRTVVLFGDSHALQWWPAVRDLAAANHWRFYNYTKSSCSPGDLLQKHPDLQRPFTECTQWRTNTIAKIVAVRPDLVLVSSLADRDTVDASLTPLSTAGSQAAWRDGLARTVSQLVSGAGRVVVIDDTPTSAWDVPSCVSAHLGDVLACSTPPAKAIKTDWIAATEAGARAGGATVVDPSLWVCPTSPCPPAIGNFLVYHDTRHLEGPFAEALAGRLAAAIPELGPIVPEPATSGDPGGR
jgi:hypothetical protein